MGCVFSSFSSFCFNLGERWDLLGFIFTYRLNVFRCQSLVSTKNWHACRRKQDTGMGLPNLHGTWPKYLEDVPFPIKKGSGKKAAFLTHNVRKSESDSCSWFVQCRQNGVVMCLGTSRDETIHFFAHWQENLRQCRFFRCCWVVKGGDNIDVWLRAERETHADKHVKALWGRWTMSFGRTRFMFGVAFET